jgi:glycosyltransferase involved in cell wall biosynthesis
MHIGIDARSLSWLEAGVGTYLSEILTGWPENKDGQRISLFSHQPILFPASAAMVHRVFLSRWGLPWYLFQAGRLINQLKPDVFWGAQNLLPRSLSSAIPSVITVHDCFRPLGQYDAPSLVNNWMHRHYLPDAAQRCYKILTVSRFVADELVRLLGVSAHKIEVFSPGVRREFFEAYSQESEIEKAVERYGLTRPFVLGVGTPEPRQNLKTLLTAFASLPTHLTESRQLVLAGKLGWKSRQLAGYLRSYPQTSRLKLIGYVRYDDLPFLYAGAEMLVFPSLHEGFGLPVAEAMAAGCPVIVSNTAALPEVTGSAGLLANPAGSPAEWARAIEQLASSVELRHALSEAGRSQARKFSWEGCSQRIAHLLKSVAAS